MWISTFAAFVPLIGLELSLGYPTFWVSFSSHLNNGSNVVTFASFGFLISGCWTLVGVLFGEWNPLTFVWITLTFGAILATQNLVKQKLSSEDKSFTGLDIILWVVLFVPLDLRWIYTNYWVSPVGLGYDWWALAITLAGLIGWGIYREWNGFGYRLIPNLKDIGIAFGSLLGFGAIVIPLGLYSGFLHWPPENVPTFIEVFTLWLENVLTVAITEELFFRMIIMNGINQTFPTQSGIYGLLVSASMFGLMHWPREAGHLTLQMLYTSFAFISGLFYGEAYRWSGNNIIAAVLVHSWTDTAWSFLLS